MKKPPKIHLKQVNEETLPSRANAGLLYQLFKGIYHIAQRTAAEANPDSLVVLLAPVNFEKPYTKKLEG